MSSSPNSLWQMLVVIFTTSSLVSYAMQMTFFFSLLPAVLCVCNCRCVRNLLDVLIFCLILSRCRLSVIGRLPPTCLFLGFFTFVSVHHPTMRQLCILHTMSFDLSDDEEIDRITNVLCLKANCMLSTSSIHGPVVLAKLFEVLCLSLCVAVTWNVSCCQLASVEMAFNGILRKIYKHPSGCHTTVLQHVAGMSSTNRVIHLFNSFLHTACSSPSSSISNLFSKSWTLVHTFLGFD